jgi:hypothetical protein
MIRSGQRTGDRVGRSFLPPFEKCFNRLLETALEQMFVSFERNQAARLHARLGRRMKAMDCVKKKQSADAFVKVRALMPEFLQLRAGTEQFLQRSGPTERVQRLIANRRIRAGNNVNQVQSCPLTAYPQLESPLQKRSSADRTCFSAETL